MQYVNKSITGLDWNPIRRLFYPELHAAAVCNLAGREVSYNRKGTCPVLPVHEIEDTPPRRERYNRESIRPLRSRSQRGKVNRVLPKGRYSDLGTAGMGDFTFLEKTGYNGDVEDFECIYSAGTAVESMAVNQATEGDKVFVPETSDSEDEGILLNWANRLRENSVRCDGRVIPRPGVGLLEE